MLNLKSNVFIKLCLLYKVPQMTLGVVDRSRRDSKCTVTGAFSRAEGDLTLSVWPFPRCVIVFRGGVGQ